MANFGRCNTNNSQFAIVSVDSPHLDGTNVAFGHVLRGFGIINEMEKIASDEAVPLKVSTNNQRFEVDIVKKIIVSLQPITIYDCGEILKGDNWNFADTDESGETLPPFVDDWERQDDDFSVIIEKALFLKVKIINFDYFRSKRPEKSSNESSFPEISSLNKIYSSKPVESTRKHCGIMIFSTKK